ncbi:Bacterial regulatory protein, tetR family [Clavibacter michiganensis]|uniref:Bacterial regulatory protein, tetR family n=1 Tax=Clavibacter michiganensis TaxID=28447 RepID=A0A251XPH8_9MICO|nr:Bacterial regulatory protein, tetR family [Clavibacter michiganensis]
MRCLPEASQASTAAIHAGSNACIVPTMTGTPCSADAAAMARPSSADTASGFSQSTARLPARHAAMTCSAWKRFGLPMTTTATAGSAISASASVVCRAPARAATRSATSASTSITWTTRNRSAMRANVGRWMACPTGPAPTRPTPNTSSPTTPSSLAMIRTTKTDSSFTVASLYVRVHGGTRGRIYIVTKSTSAAPQRRGSDGATENFPHADADESAATDPAAAAGMASRGLYSTGVRRRAEIVAAAVRVFGVRGYGAATIKEIADEVGVSPRPCSATSARRSC